MHPKKIITTLIALFFIASSATAQNVTYTLSDAAEFTISGDSNLRTWEGDVTDIEATLVLTAEEGLTVESLTTESIESIDIRIAVAGIETDTGRLTTNLRNYLKGDDFPYITFSLNQIHEIDLQNEKAVITADGTITAAGVERAVTMTVDTFVNSDGSIRFTGTKDMLMTDFEIDPPTAMFGTIRADDEILITFDVLFAQ
jgi:polyisoprenoid-binding protein YceI